MTSSKVDKLEARVQPLEKTQAPSKQAPNPWDQVISRLSEVEQLDLSRALGLLAEANGGASLDGLDLDEVQARNPGLLSEAQRGALVKVYRIQEELIRGQHDHPEGGES